MDSDTRDETPPHKQAESEWVLTNLGPRIRELRKNRGMTLAELASQTGYSEGYMSGVETSATVPSISALSVIAAVLGVDVSAFFPRTVEPEVTIHRASSTNHLKLSESSTESYSILTSRLDNPAYTALRHEFTEIDSSATYRYAGERFGLVISGELTLAFDNQAFPLTAGDTFHYSSHPEHVLLLDEGSPRAEILWIVTPALIR